ncbi:hypothetical protein GHT06_005710 [Daphnia sinensis]|uniref:Uncharacterized protein n=1 Tax=Daphnia sinensis TaxID=1820382 RepID=A0AAD5KS30_9CRUS|nr:hypothetical protein GHT06_005710 [Daphnia sinensis]
MSTNPANVAAFYTACNNLPTSLAAPAAENPTKSADPVDPSAALEAKIVISKNEGVSGYGAGTGATGRPRGASKTDLIVQKEKLVSVSKPETNEVLTARTTSEKISSKSVRFGEVRVTVFDQRKAAVDSKVSERAYQCGDEEEPWDITDELIASFQEEGRYRKRRGGQSAKILRRTAIPVDSLKFVACRVGSKQTGTVLVRPIRCCFPGKEFCVPSCLVSIKKGIVSVPVLNLSTQTLHLKARDRLTKIECAYDGHVQLVEDQGPLEDEEEEKTSSGESLMCAAVHWNERLAAVKEEIQLGSGLNEEQRLRVLDAVSKHIKCFPTDAVPHSAFFSRLYHQQVASNPS